MLKGDHCDQAQTS